MGYLRTTALRARANAPAHYRSVPRIDLRTGAVVSALLEVDAPLLSVNWVALMSEARAAWTAPSALLSCRASGAALADGVTARDLDGALREAGFAMGSVSIEVDEENLALDRGAAFAALEQMRARGWGVTLRCAPTCPLPFGGAARGIFTEIWAPIPPNALPLLALARDADDPLTRRVRAASSAGLHVTAANFGTLAHAPWLIAAGFDRGETPA